MAKTNPYLLLTILILITKLNVLAQSDTFFVPTKSDSLFFSKEFADIEARFKENLKNLPKEYKKDLTEIYTERFNFFKENFAGKKLFANEYAKNYLQKVVAEIVNNNSELKSKPLNVFFITTEIPNAAFVGENAILFHTGLLSKLNTESEFAFVLCHELAHFYLNHINQQIEKHVATINSKEFQAELKRIKKAEYKTKENVEKLALGLAFDNRRHSRFKESEADSLALVFMSKTKFDLQESVSLLKILDALDDEKIEIDKKLELVLNSSNYPFEKRWLDAEEGLLGGHAEIKEDEKLADSLKTHPDCKKRILEVQRLLGNYNQATKQQFVVSEPIFRHFKNQFFLEDLNYYFNTKNFGIAFYYAIKNFNKYENNPYLVTLIGSLFVEFYLAQKNHYFGKYVSLPSPDNGKAYNTALQFLHNLNLDDYAKIGYGFLMKYEKTFAKHPLFASKLNELKKINNK